MSHLQFSLRGFTIDGFPDREKKADLVRVWTDGGCVVSVARRRTGWIYEGSDYGILPEHWDIIDKKFETWREALDAFGCKEVIE